jgi:cytidylate kinase
MIPRASATTSESELGWIRFQHLLEEPDRSIFIPACSKPLESMIVTIDGPAGAGKSSVSKRLADALGFVFLDTGAMYRCVTLACLQRGIALDHHLEVAAVAHDIQIHCDGNRIALDGEDVTERIREPRVSQSIKAIADNTLVRRAMVDLQRRWCTGKDAVTEGRDQGTVAFPDAACKIFLTASPEERARRRVEQLAAAGIAADLSDILEQQNLRDLDDRSRPTGGLKQAEDAVEVHTDGLTEDEVLDRLIHIVRSKMK